MSRRIVWWLHWYVVVNRGSEVSRHPNATKCAYMLIQPNMQLSTDLSLQDDLLERSSTSELGTTLLAEAVEARKASNYIEFPTPVSVTTSFFLFGCYFCLEKHNTAYFHLREATTIALLLGMNQEDGYTGTDVVEAVLKRRLYWLLFVTERSVWLVPTDHECRC